MLLVTESSNLESNKRGIVRVELWLVFRRLELGLCISDKGTGIYDGFSGGSERQDLETLCEFL